MSPCQYEGQSDVEGRLLGLGAVAGVNPFIGLDGNYYGFGADTTAIWIYHNPEHLNRIDMKPPTTWAEFMEACAKLKAKGITPYTQAGGIGWPISWWWVEIYEGGERSTYSYPLPELLDAWQYREEAAFFVRALCTGEPFRSSGEDTLTDVRLCEEIYQAVIRGSRLVVAHWSR